MDDLIDAFVLFIAPADSVTGPSNLGNPAEFIVRKLAETVIQLTVVKSDLILLHLPADDPKQRKPDLTRTTATIGWTPRTELSRVCLRPPFFDELLKRGIKIDTWSPV